MFFFVRNEESCRYDVTKIKRTEQDGISKENVKDKTKLISLKRIQPPLMNQIIDNMSVCVQKGDEPLLQFY